ncbi:MAG: sigma-70 family RNA polymerase sigma factor [Planctomycetota bacterium]
MSDTSPQTDDYGNLSQEFVQLLTGEQFRLHRYIYVLLGDLDAASNVLQDTNVALWRKSHQFQLGTNFSAWSRKVAFWEVRAYLRDRKRDRHVFTAELVEQLMQREEEEDPAEVEVRVALRHCLQSVSASNREMLRLRYEEGLAITALAEQVQKTPSAVKVGLMRIRRALMECIQRQINSASVS